MPSHLALRTTHASLTCSPSSSQISLFLSSEGRHVGHQRPCQSTKGHGTDVSGADCEVWSAGRDGRLGEMGVSPSGARQCRQSNCDEDARPRLACRRLWELCTRSRAHSRPRVLTACPRTREAPRTVAPGKARASHSYFFLQGLLQCRASARVPRGGRGVGRAVIETSRQPTWPAFARLPPSPRWSLRAGPAQSPPCSSPLPPSAARP